MQVQIRLWAIFQVQMLNESVDSGDYEMTLSIGLGLWGLSWREEIAEGIHGEGGNDRMTTLSIIQRRVFLT